MGIEQRQHGRIYRPFSVSFRIYDQENQKGISPWNIITVKDLSAGGIFFYYTKKIDKDTITQFKISIPTLLEPFYCLGIVRRIEEPASDNTYSGRIPIWGIAVQFTEIEEKNKIIIEDYFKQK